MFSWLKSLFGTRDNHAPRTHGIKWDERGISRDLPGGKSEGLAWADLIRVSVLTTDEGPFVEDVYFLLESADGKGCAVPQEADHDSKLLEFLQKLPGFDNEQFIRSMTSAENARFICWERTPQA
jgi:hypothetical protein